MQEERAAVVEQQADAGSAPQQGVKKHHGFSGKIGFVLAAAGSAVGLGNLWRFPYLAAKYGGGIFILCYIILAATVGITLLMLEIAIGRKTGKGVLGAFAALNKKFKWLGFLCLVVPVIIVPYYCVIGGWVVKYIVAFLGGASGLVASGGAAVDTDAYFTSFIADPWQPLVFFLIFAAATIFVVVFGVQKGIERISKVLMPLLAVISVALMVYVLCQGGALEGIAYLFTPDFSQFGYETLLERAQNERSIFHQARDLEMKSQWQIAAQQYYASQLSSSETEMREEAASGYYRCLQAGGNWHAALLMSAPSSYSLSQNSQLLYWKIEACWRENDWNGLLRNLEEFEWLWRNRHEKTGSSEKWLFSDRQEDEGLHGFSYYLGKMLLAVKEDRHQDLQTCIDRSRFSVVRTLASTPMSTIQMAYDSLLHLHIIQDIAFSGIHSGSEVGMNGGFDA